MTGISSSRTSVSSWRQLWTQQQPVFISFSFLCLLIHASLLSSLFIYSSPSTFTSFTSSTSSSSLSFISQVSALTVFVGGRNTFISSSTLPGGATKFAAVYSTEDQTFKPLSGPSNNAQSAFGNGVPLVISSPGNDQAYFGGSFTRAGDAIHSGFAKYDADRRAWVEVTGGTANTAQSSSVSAIFTDPCRKDLVIVGGGFTSVSTQVVVDPTQPNGVRLINPTVARMVAQWNPSTQEWNPLGNGLDGSVLGTFVQEDIVYVVGSFQGGAPGSFDPAPAPFLNGVASYSLTAGIAGTWQSMDFGIPRRKLVPNFGRVYHGVCVAGVTKPRDNRDRNIYVSGSFTEIGSSGLQVTSVAKWVVPSQSWAPLGVPGLDGPKKDPYNYIPALAVAGGADKGGDARIYIGGSFTCLLTNSQRNVSNICFFSESSQAWLPMGGTTLGADAAVMGLAVAYDPLTRSDTVYAVGDFDFIDGVQVSKMAVWNGDSNTWFPLGDGSASYGISEVALSLPCNPIPLSISPSTSPSASPLPSELVTCRGELCNDGNPCTIDFCTDAGCIHEPKTCNDGDLCTMDSCSRVTGECIFTPLASCQTEFKTCETFTDCGSCASADVGIEGCAWLQCAPENAGSGLGNFTTFPLSANVSNTGSNVTNFSEFAVFTTENVTLLLEDPITGEVTKVPQFSLGSIRVYFTSTDDLRRTSAFGATRVTTGQCVPTAFKAEVLANNEPFGLTCEFVEKGGEDSCGFLLGNFNADQLGEQAKTIGAAAGATAAAGGGGCGFFVVALLFYRRKKSTEIREAKVANVSKSPTWTDIANTPENPVYEGTQVQNELYSEEV